MQCLKAKNDKLPPQNMVFVVILKVCVLKPTDLPSPTLCTNFRIAYDAQKCCLGRFYSTANKCPYRGPACLCSV